MPSLFGRHSRKSSKSKDKEKEREREREPPPAPRESSEKAEREKPSTSKPKHQRTRTEPVAETPTLSRLLSTHSTHSTPASRTRRASNPTTPIDSTPYTASSTTTTTTSASYFSPQPAVSTPGTEPRSPATRRAPASFSAGTDTSRGPPISRITRGNWPSQQQQQQQQQLGLVSPGGAQGRHANSHDDADSATEATPRPHQTKPPPSRLSRHNSARSNPPPPPPQMASSSEESSSDEDSSPPSRFEDHEEQRPQQTKQTKPPPSRLSRHISARTNPPPPPPPQDMASSSEESEEGQQSEDLFLNIAKDVAPKQRQPDSITRHDKLRSRIGRINRMSSPSALQSPSSLPSSSTTPTTSRIPSSAERSAVQPRRASHLPSTARNQQERPPQSPSGPFETPKSRPPDLSTKASFSRKDSDLSPREFLAQIGTRRRGSQPESLQTPPARTGTYRPSNLGHYSSTRDENRSPIPEAAPTTSQPDGTESLGSTGPAVSVWDELDELKTRIRRIEMGGKIPPTSSQVISQATAERPRTANTSATTVSSSPNQQRKTGPSPSESTVDTHTNNRIHPLLRDALVKVRQHTSPAVYRILESTATEAMSLAEMTGSAGPQGTLHSASSILGGASISDRQVRRKADNICRSLTELCIALCDTKPSLSSPSVRTSTATITRRPSVQIKGDSPTVRQSIEPESNTLTNISPSRAMHRIEARRTSMLNGSGRESSLDTFDYDRQNPSRLTLSRAGTSLHRNRQSVDDDEEEPTIRAPSRAMTDFRSLRGTDKSRLAGRHYTSREPLPELQAAPALQTSATLRRPTVTGTNNESLLFRDGSRRYDFQRESSPALERQQAGTLRARQQLAASRNPNNRNSISGISEIGRNVSVGRRLRGNSTGE